MGIMVGTAVQEWMVIKMYDELIKQLRGCVDSLCGECPYKDENTKQGNFVPCMNKLLSKAADALQESVPQWIPFEVRDLDEEEKEEHPEWDWILEGKLPENGQRILVNVQYKRHESVQMDEYCDADGCYLDSGYEIGTEVTHWMPLPKPFKDGKT